jgi:hypothetical protein
MNRIIIGVLAFLAIAIGWFILNPEDTFDYVVHIDQEVEQLENELAELDTQVAAGTLTPAQATAAKVQIIARLDAINNSAVESEKIQLTPEQRTQLANGLLRLKDALVKYQATLNVVEDTAVEAEVKAQLNPGHRGGGRHLNLVVADTIDAVEETVQDSIQDYEADAELDAQVDEVVAEIEAQETINAEAEEAAEEGTSTTSEDTAVENTSTTSEESMGEEDTSISDVEASYEAEVEVSS